MFSFPFSCVLAHIPIILLADICYRFFFFRYNVFLPVNKYLPRSAQIGQSLVVIVTVMVTQHFFK